MLQLHELCFGQDFGCLELPGEVGLPMASCVVAHPGYLDCSLRSLLKDRAYGMASVLASVTEHCVEVKELETSARHIVNFY